MRIKFTDGKSEHVQKLYSDMLDILVAVGIPVGELTTDRRREKMAGACLAAGQIVESFKEAKSVMNGSFLTTRRIIEFENEHYGEQISSGSYDDIRRKDLKLLVDEGYVVNSSVLDQSATNNPNRGYTLSAPFANLIKVYGTSKWEKQLAYFIDVHQKAKEELERKRAMERIPVTLPSGVTLESKEMATQLSAALNASVPIDVIEQRLLIFPSTTALSVYMPLNTMLQVNAVWQAHSEGILQKILAKQQQELQLSMNITAQPGSNVNGIVQQQMNNGILPNKQIASV